ncbi:homeobox protein engrailed-1-B-like [Dreissena polymorpha]|uniref:homeobox protein engrailed-1-B-like n=1 Tax=Dreissena polymorpha TaxID=45954 RepID=UPI0022655B51|nr:homeobox protein engrailed-1-B-like [Dreissena polymorpha]
MTWSEILRRKYKEDGYTSSDFDSALDLRIQRKKTPPATTTDALPAWVFCTRYSDRPSAGPRAKRRRHTQRHRKARTAFKDAQVRVLNIEFDKDPYLSESRRHQLAEELDLDADNVKIQEALTMAPHLHRFPLPTLLAMSPVKLLR